MKKSTWSRDLLVMLAALCVAGVAVVWVQRITGRIDGVAMLIFMLAVFVTSMYTDGYLWGVLASLASVLAVNFAFFTPYFAFNFTLPENLFSGLVMLAVSIMTSTLTTRVKKQEQLRMETEREKMRANLLRAVSHDLRTPLTSIYGACSTVTENYDSLGKEQALKLLREACEDAQWLNRMVENLLSVTRFDGEQVTVKCSVLLDQSVEKVTGKGAGLTNKDLEHKIEVIRQSIALNKVNADDPLDVLAKVGGLDIAGMAGCYIGGAALNIPVFIDGFISSVAALIAIRLVPECAPYLFPSHCSNEPAGRMILDAIGKQPYIFANMCLGEGTGAVMGFTIADYAFKAYWELPSFEQTNFGTYEELN